MSYNKRVAAKIRSVCGPLLWDDEKGLKLGQLGGIWKDFWSIGFLEEFQRRGAHVNVPEIGSRVGVYCIGGILGFYAELRREFNRGN
jgi:hypothetical protein